VLVVNIAVKALALAEYLLGYFVVLGDPLHEVGNAECGFVCNVYQPAMTACGSSLLDMEQAIEYLTDGLNAILSCVLFAVS
jgi:hypothetical protein